jgi:hypothetical protein
MYKTTFFRGNLLVRMPFTRPILDVRSFAAQFNELIYAAVAPAFPVTPADLSVNSSNRLSEIWAKFNLYAGPNSVTLFTDRLAFDFLNLSLPDYPLVYDLLRRVHDEFPLHFKLCDYERVEAQSFVHLELQPPAEATQYLKRFEHSEELALFSTLGGGFVVEEPGARMGVIAANSSWRSRMGIERSVAIANGVYVEVSTALHKGSKEVPFDEKLRLAQSVNDVWLRILALEQSDV